MKNDRIIPRGTEVAFAVKIQQEGFNMERDDFAVDLLYGMSGKHVRIEKSDMRTELEGRVWLFDVDTTDMIAEVTAVCYYYVPDEEASGGIREMTDRQTLMFVVADSKHPVIDVADDEIDTRNVSYLRVVEGTICDGEIIGRMIADQAVTTDKIADNNVTEDKLADKAVTTDKLADDTITELTTIMDSEPVEGSVKPIQSGGVFEALLDRVIMGDIVGDPAKAWEPGTAEAYIDQRISQQNALMDSRMDRQDIVIKAYHGNKVVIVNELPESGEEETIYRVPASDHYTDYMWDTSLETPAFAEIATFDFPGVDDVPTANSDYLVKSGGVYEAINDIQHVEEDDEYLWMVADVLNVDVTDKSKSRPVTHTIDTKDILLGVRADRSVFLGKKVPLEIRDYIDEKVREVSGMGDADFYNILNLRANQAQNIKWTPISDVQMAGSVTSRKFEAGTEYKGVPYSSAMENDKLIGYDVSIESFMTSVHNPYSLFYTENLRLNTSKYGYTYVGGRSTVGGYMGMVCNVYSLWSLGFDIPWDTGMFAYLASIGELIKIDDQSRQGLKTGDILWKSGHDRLVKNVVRDDNGMVTQVTVTEAIETTTGNPPSTERNLNWTTGLSNEFFNSDHGIVYRVPKKNRNPEFNTMHFGFYGSNVNGDYVYNNDICVYGGEKSCYREGFKVVINYDLTDTSSHVWTALELYKDDVLVYSKALSEFDQTGYDSSLQGHAINLGNELTPGMYKARLTDGTNYSGYTNFEVLEADATYEVLSNGSAKISFSSSNGAPLFVRFSKSNGAPKAIYKLTAKDIENGYCVIDVAAVIASQYNNLSEDDTCCKVSFQGKYGRVTNVPILITI